MDNCKIDPGKILDTTALFAAGIIDKPTLLEQLEENGKNCNCVNCKKNKKSEVEYIKELVMTCKCDKCMMRKNLSGL